MLPLIRTNLQRRIGYFTAHGLSVSKFWGGFEEFVLNHRRFCLSRQQGRIAERFRTKVNVVPLMSKML